MRLVSILGALCLVAATAAGQEIGKIKFVSGSAAILRGSSAAKATPGDSLRLNDIVRVGPKAAIRIVLLDASELTVGEVAELRVVTHNPESQQTTIEMLFGHLRAKVTPVTKQGGFFQVRTPTGVAVALGTVVEVNSILDTASAATPGVLNARSIEDLPLNGRDPFKLLQLQPGIAGGQSSAAPPSNSSIWMVDGQQTTGEPLALPSLESIMNVPTTSANPYWYPGPVTRSGSNTFHGSPYEEWRTTSSIGGPVLKDRLLFFASNSIAAQSGLSSSVSGALQAPSGQPIPNAILSLTGNGPMSVTRTDTNGVFNFSKIRPGDFIFTVQGSGLAPTTLNDLNVPGGVRVDLGNLQVPATGGTFSSGVTVPSYLFSPNLRQSSDPSEEAWTRSIPARLGLDTPQEPPITRRWHSPSLGGFLTPDHSGFYGGPNQFGLNLGNALTFTDRIDFIFTDQIGSNFTFNPDFSTRGRGLRLLPSLHFGIPFAPSFTRTASSAQPGSTTLSTPNTSSPACRSQTCADLKKAYEKKFADAMTAATNLSNAINNGTVTNAIRDAHSQAAQAAIDAFNAWAAADPSIAALVPPSASNQVASTAGQNTAAVQDQPTTTAEPQLHMEARLPLRWTGGPPFPRRGMTTIVGGTALHNAPEALQITNDEPSPTQNPSNQIGSNYTFTVPSWSPIPGPAPTHYDHYDPDWMLSLYGSPPLHKPQVALQITNDEPWPTINSGNQIGTNFTFNLHFNVTPTNPLHPGGLKTYPHIFQTDPGMPDSTSGDTLGTANPYGWSSNYSWIRQLQSTIDYLPIDTGYWDYLEDLFYLGYANKFDYPSYSQYLDFLAWNDDWDDDWDDGDIEDYVWHLAMYHDEGPLAGTSLVAACQFQAACGFSNYTIADDHFFGEYLTTEPTVITTLGDIPPGVTPGSTTEITLASFRFVKQTDVIAWEHWTASRSWSGGPTQYGMPGQVVVILPGKPAMEPVALFTNGKPVLQQVVSRSTTWQPGALREFNLAGHSCTIIWAVNGVASDPSQQGSFKALYKGNGISTGNAVGVEITNNGNCPLYYFVGFGIVLQPHSMLHKVGAVAGILLGGDLNFNNVKSYQIIIAFGGLVVVPPGQTAVVTSAAATIPEIYGGGVAEQQTATAGAGTNVGHMFLRSYCLELHKLAPHVETEYSIGDAELQERLGPNASYLQRIFSGVQSGSIKVPTGHSLDGLIQWTLWAEREGMDEKKFIEAYLTLVHHNYEAQKKKWDKDAERLVREQGEALWSAVSKIIA